MDKNKRVLLFVYGTLQDGYKNHNRFQQFVARLKIISKEAITKEKYAMYPQIDYFFPYMIEHEDKIQIQGELFEVDSNFLTVLDKFEGVPKHYYRKEIEVLASNQTYQVYSYFRSNDTNPYSYHKEILINKWTLDIDSLYANSFDKRDDTIASYKKEWQKGK